MVLAPVNHATSSPTPDPSPPPPPEKMSPNGANSNGADRTARAVTKTQRSTTDEGGASEALTDAKEAAREAAKARLRARERWPREAQTLTRFSRVHAGGPAAARDVRAPQRGHCARRRRRGRRPSRTPAAPPLSGKIQREPRHPRRARPGRAVQGGGAGRRAAGAAAHDDASDSDDGEYASVCEAGGSTFVPTRRLDNAALYREGARGVHKNGDKNKNVGASIDDRDPGFVPGSPFVAGVDAVLDVAETFAGGTGEHMGKPERDLLLAPDIAPALPGQSSKKAATEGKASKTPYTQDVYRGHTRPVVFLDVLPIPGRCSARTRTG